MPDVKVNMNRVRDAAKAYENYAGELESLLNRLKADMDNLLSEWKGLARNSYTEQKFPTLYNSMMQYVQKVKTLEEALDFTAKEFSSLDCELK